MELLDVLRHGGEPKTEYFLECPSEYGNLRLDLYSPVGTALAKGGTPPDDAKDADRRIAEGWKLAQTGSAQWAVSTFKEVTRRYPYYPAGYEALYELYSMTDILPEAEYQLKQEIALAPTYANLTLLGGLLGRQGKFDMAALIEDHLWETRSHAAPEEARSAAADYLITLSKSGNYKKMLEVATQAVKEFGDDPRFVYQYVLACILNDQFQEARYRIAEALQQVSPQHPFYPKLQEMSDYIKEHFS